MTSGFDFGLLLSKNATLVILGKLHKVLKWKDFFKGVIDQFGNNPPIPVTGSARLELLRHGGDALTGRTWHHRYGGAAPKPTWTLEEIAII